MGYIQTFLHRLLLAGAAMGVLASGAQADTMVGRVISASGPNSVERDGPTVALTKGSYIFEEDIIYTGEGASLTIEWFDSHETILGDNSMIFVREMLQSASKRAGEEYRVTGAGTSGSTTPGQP